MFTVFGFGGQHAYNYLDQRNSEAVRKQAVMKEEGKVDDNWLRRIAKSKWSPMSILTDEKYEKMLNEKLLSVEAEIALIDERMEEFRKKQNEQERSQEREKK